MMEYIKGTLVKASPIAVIVDVNNIGYRVLIPPNLLSNLPAQGSEITLYTSLLIKETVYQLYGFGEEQERDLFDTLIGISGIGPKTAIALVGSLSYQHLLDAVNTNNVHAITRVPGIGKKTAERLIIDIRDKLPSIFKKNQMVSLSKLATSEISSETITDAMSALINLGYNQSNAEKAVARVIAKATTKKIDLSTLIAQALQNV